MIPPKGQRLQLIQEFMNSAQRIKQESNDQGLIEKEFMKLYESTLDSITSAPKNPNIQKRKKLAAFLILGLTLLIVVANYKVIYSCVACNLQDYIYPGLRMIRTLFIPLLTWGSTLTADMDCWPCSTVNDIIEVNNPQPSLIEQSKPPFIYKSKQEVINLDDLKHFYSSNKHVFDEEAPRILSDNKIYIHPSDMINQQESGKKHNYVWKFNNMNVAKTLRQIIPRPQVVPMFGQSTERYVIIDTSQEKFDIPDTECNFSFLLSLSGSRIIELKPAEECLHQCQSLKVELNETYLLWYNWWYWRPVVQPSTGNTTFIAHVGSYC